MLETEVTIDYQKMDYKVLAYQALQNHNYFLSFIGLSNL